MENTKHNCLLSRAGLLLLILSICVGCSSAGDKSEKWDVPVAAHQTENPFSNNKMAFEKGKQLYQLYCRSCHGKVGYGDGPARGPMKMKPSDFHSEKVKKQTNGDLFWKISTGRKDMPAFGKSLSEEQRWQLVTFVRSIPEKSDVALPTALRHDIKVQHFMRVQPEAVRILQHHGTSDLWYTTINGDVYRIGKTKDNQLVSEKTFSIQDHGIAILQGAAFLGNTLLLCGNVYTDDKKSTWGRMVRLNLDSAKQHQLAVVFTTAKYAANKTIYDHGWNALAISPDAKFIYVNSGARTDHGEIQDNGGVYPNARDNALTSKIFRFAADAKDLFLDNNEAKLKDDGYIYADGIRNAYDMSFDQDGNLFAVSNSADYDYPEDMFWIRKDHHYGFPWVMGGLENPQQYNDWQPDAETNQFINPSSHSWKTKYYYNDPDFPKPPANVTFSTGVQNLGPDANEYRGHSGKIQDGDQAGVTISTFTAHSSPLGLFFDTKKILSEDLNGDAFVMRFSEGEKSSLMRPFTNQGADLLHLQLQYVQALDNYVVRTVRIVEGFNDPVDAVMVENDVYVIEYAGREGNIWKITLPPASKSLAKTKL